MYILSFIYKKKYLKRELDHTFFLLMLHTLINSSNDVNFQVDCMIVASKIYEGKLNELALINYSMCINTGAPQHRYPTSRPPSYHATPALTWQQQRGVGAPQPSYPAPQAPPHVYEVYNNSAAHHYNNTHRPSSPQYVNQQYHQRSSSPSKRSSLQYPPQQGRQQVYSSSISSTFDPHRLQQEQVSHVTRVSQHHYMGQLQLYRRHISYII